MEIDKLHFLINKRINVAFFSFEDFYREKISAVIVID